MLNITRIKILHASVDVTTLYISTQIQEMCYGQETLGMEACIKARVPSLSTLRFSDVPVFPFFAQTNLRMRIVPKDKIQNIEVQVNLDKQKRE